MEFRDVGRRARKAVFFWRAIARRRWTAGEYVSRAAPVVIGGCPRSGTTLLRVLLDRHPSIACGPESKLFIPDWPSADELAHRYEMPEELVRGLLAAAPSQAEFIDRFFAEHCRRLDKKRWAEKTPLNVRYADFVFAHFPDARFVHILRDGRDTVASLRTFPSHAVVNGRRVPLDTRNPIDRCARRWVRDVRAGLRHRGDPRYTEVRYEALATRPEETLRPLFEFLGEPFDPCVLRPRPEEKAAAKRPLRDHANSPEASAPIHTRALSRYLTDLDVSELETVMRIAGDLLRELGYACDPAGV